MHLYLICLFGVIICSDLCTSDVSLDLYILFEFQVYVLMAFPQSLLTGLVHKNCKVALILHIVMIVIMVVFIFSYIFLMLSAGRREMHLCVTLIKQMEATQRESMNKSLAFATASHYVRAALAGITSLIEISYDEVAPSSELETNLRQMDSCMKDLLGILNSVLDTSQIEAAKMRLEEEEFEVAQLLEDVVDLYHPVGLRKGIDVALGPYDGSVIKFSRVKGDMGRLKQILCNLISNAVKFTPEGRAAVHAWVENPSFKNSIVASDRNIGVMRQLLCFFNKNIKAKADRETMNVVQRFKLFGICI